MRAARWSPKPPALAGILKLLQRSDRLRVWVGALAPRRPNEPRQVAVSSVTAAAASTHARLQQRQWGLGLQAGVRAWSM